MVVGSGHSAINAVLDLASLQETYPDTEIYWAMRSVNLAQVYGGGDDDQLPARGALGTRVKALVDNGHVQIVSPFYVTRIQDAEGGLCVESDNSKQVLVDRIIGTTGARPDLAMLRELRLDLDSSLESTRTLAPLIDPNIHSCGTVPPHGEAELRHPEENFYMVGMKSYGRAPSFLLATGYEQVRSVAAYLTGDYEAAKDVQLNLPETGVCSTDFVDGGGACCGTTSEVAVEPVGTIQLLDISVGSKASGSSCC
ncbi:MAG: flavoprotein, partial [Chloroflexota bacterium]